jgi:predicted DNA-binding protein
MARPRKDNNLLRKQIQITIPTYMHQYLQHASNRSTRTMSRMIEEALRDHYKLTDPQKNDTDK